MEHRKIGQLATTVVLALSSLASNAALISYDVTAKGNNYTYDYTLDNSVAGSSAFLGFSIYFDTNLYDESSLTITGTPDGWDGLILSEPGFGFAAADWCLGGPTCLGPEIQVGDIVSGFSISFDWLGGPDSLPGIQDFDTYDSGFAVVEVGTTAAVPEPSTWLLFASGLIGLFASAKRRV